MRVRDRCPLLRRVAAVLALGLTAVVIAGACGPAGGPKVDEGAGTVELGAVLLTVPELPAGFTKAPATEDDGGLCKEIDQATKVDSTAQVEVAFFGSQQGPFIDHEVTSYPGGGATQAMGRVVDAIESCASVERKNPDGSTSEATYSRTEFPEVGDEVVAARIELSGPLRLRADVVFVRLGDAVIAFSNQGLESEQGPTFDASLTEPLVRRAVEKLTKL